MTRETEKAFKILYCEYKSRRNHKESKKQAVYFSDSMIHALEKLKSWNPDDIDCAVKELQSNGFVQCDICGGVTILNDGLEWIEARPKEFWKDVLDLVGNLL